jgi:hypothetical protein
VGTAHQEVLAVVAVALALAPAYRHQVKETQAVMVLLIQAVIVFAVVEAAREPLAAHKQAIQLAVSAARDLILSTGHFTLAAAAATLKAAHLGLAALELAALVQQVILRLAARQQQIEAAVVVAHTLLQPEEALAVLVL